MQRNSYFEPECFADSIPEFHWNRATDYSRNHRCRYRRSPDKIVG
jgi:hypothetical protein